MELQDLKKIVDLESLLVEYGYQRNKEKSTRAIPVYDNGSEYLIIRQGNDCKTYYVSHSEEKGTIIDFLKNRPELLKNYPARNVFESIKKCLSHLANISPELVITENKRMPQPSVFSAKAFFIPKNKDIETRCFSYLKHRGITQDTLSSPVFSNTGLVKIITAKEGKEGACYNLAFPLFGKDETLRGIDYRFINQKGQDFKMLFPGTDKKNSIGFSSNKREGISEVVLTESPIDAMSHYQLFRKGRTNIQYLYFDGTLTKEQIELFLDYKKKIGDPQITLGFDNDLDGNLTGQAYTTSILCSMLCNAAITLSYAGKEQFAFRFNNNLTQNKELFKSALKGVEGIEYVENEHSFSFCFPKVKNVINQVNNTLISFLDNTYIDIPLTNDWNDDVKMKHQNSKNIILPKRSRNI